MALWGSSDIPVAVRPSPHLQAPPQIAREMGKNGDLLKYKHSEHLATRSCFSILCSYTQLCTAVYLHILQSMLPYNHYSISVCLRVRHHTIIFHTHFGDWNMTHRRTKHFLSFSLSLSSLFLIFLHYYSASLHPSLDPCIIPFLFYDLPHYKLTPCVLLSILTSISPPSSRASHSRSLFYSLPRQEQY